MLKYSYNLEYAERPNYNYLRFMLKKILLDLDYIPDNTFDWSLFPGKSFPKVDPDDRHSSISSCGINSSEDIDCDHKERIDNITLIQERYHSKKNTAMPLLMQASNLLHGKGEK